MKQLVVLSGKGGTGKTSITASFTALATQTLIVDADVDAADMHLLLNPEIKESGNYSGGVKAHLQPDKCIHCDLCREHCRFGAISGEHVIDIIACEGCGFCSRICPTEAIEMKEAFSGNWFVSDTQFGPFIHAKLGIASENSGKLVSLIRQKAVERAEQDGLSQILIDGSPGVGCPVIASVTGCDLVLCITEPTQSGLHDLKRVVELAQHFSVPITVAVNKADLNEQMSEEIENYCNSVQVRSLGRIPFDPEVVKAVAAGEILTEFSAGPASQAVKALWEKVKQELDSTGESDNVPE